LIFKEEQRLAPRDVTPEALEPILKDDSRNIEEGNSSAMGQQKSCPMQCYPDLSVGTIGNCLILALPGSTKGVWNPWDAVFRICPRYSKF